MHIAAEETQEEVPALPLLARRIRQARKESNLTQEQLAERVHELLPSGYQATRFDIIGWEKGREPRPLLVKLAAIAVATGRTVEWLVAEELAAGTPEAEMHRAAFGLIAALSEALRQNVQTKAPR